MKVRYQMAIGTSASPPSAGGNVQDRLVISNPFADLQVTYPLVEKGVSPSPSKGSDTFFKLAEHAELG
jgi:hypothetical protein